MDFAPNANWEAIAFVFGWLALSVPFCFMLDYFVEDIKK